MAKKKNGKNNKTKDGIFMGLLTKNGQGTGIERKFILPENNNAGNMARRML